MIKVISVGKLETFRITCPECESVLEFTKNDIRRSNFPSMFRYEFIGCPTCGKCIRFDSKSTKKIK